jgi:hypothetical protein
MRNDKAQKILLSLILLAIAAGILINAPDAIAAILDLIGG